MTYHTLRLDLTKLFAATRKSNFFIAAKSKSRIVFRNWVTSRRNDGHCKSRSKNAKLNCSSVHSTLIGTLTLELIYPDFLLRPVDDNRKPERVSRLSYTAWQRMVWRSLMAWRVSCGAAGRSTNRRWSSF